MKASDYIIKYIEALGVEDVFILPGGGCIHLIDSLGKNNKLNYICNLHEQAAGMAAEAYSQYTGNIGVAIVTTGPGSTNIITPIAGAWLDSIPLLVICGQVNSYDRACKHGHVRQYGFQEINMVSLVRNITKYAATVQDENDIPWMLEYALRQATEGRPGPVVLEIPLDIQGKNIDREYIECHDKTENYKFIDEKDERKIQEVINLIKNSERPIILAGGGIRASQALGEFYKFIEYSKIPVLTTWKGIDYLDEEHPLFVGRPGAIATRGANFNQQNADLIICIGARLDQGQLAYQPQYFAREAKKIIVDIDQKELDKDPNGLKINTSAKKFLYSLNKKLHHINFEYKWWLNHCKNLYKKYRDVWKEHEEATETGKVSPYSFMNVLSTNLSEDSLIIPGSSGTCSEITMQVLRVPRGARVFNTEGLGSMGYGLSAAIGGCIASGKQSTICIEGDGGIMMNIQELEVVRRLNLPIKIFVLNNNGYGAIQTTQDKFFKNRVASDPESGLTLPSLEKIAKSYNIPYSKIDRKAYLDYIVSSVVNSSDGPVLCEIFIDPNHRTLPKVTSIQKEDGSFTSLPMEDMSPRLPREEFLRNLMISPIE